MSYAAVLTKRRVEEIIMFPFVLLGKIAGRLFPLKTKHGAVLFFPNADIGGSPQVNIDITECIRDCKPLIIFSKKPKNNQFSDKFKIPSVRIIDLHPYIDHKLFHFVNFFFRGVIASWIHQQEKTVVFGGECIFFYKVIPHLKPRIRCIELSHLATWLPYSLAFINRIDLRIFSTEKLREMVETQYRESGVPAAYESKLVFTDNAIDIPAFIQVQNDQLEVYFIGRGAPQKRVHLTVAIAKRLHEKNIPVHFNFVGDVENIIDVSAYPYCRFYGNVSDQLLMKKIYETADILIMTSSFEGLPIVVMQMMAHGKVVVSTAVNGIPDYIRHMENGLLIYTQHEEEIITEGANLIIQLQKDPALRSRLGKKSREIAIQKFSREHFCKTYRSFLQLD